MFKRESEQPVKVSFEEKKNNKEKRSLRERLSNIPLRRRVEAVLLAVVTIMASLSIDWSSLSARAEEGETTMQSKQSISMIFRPSQGQETTTLTEAKISVKIPSAAKAVTVNWKVYQNLEDETDPESGASVGNGGSGTISYKDGDFVEYKADLNSSKVVLLGNETAAVVFTLQSNDGYDITYKTYDNTDTRYVKENGHWNAHETGSCIQYESSAGGNPVPVELLGVPEKLALTAGETYDFSEKNSIELASKYKRTLTLTKSETDLIDEEIEYPIFKITDDVNKSGPATVTIGGTGIDPKNVDVKVVSFAVNEKNGKAKDGKWVFTYTGKEFTAADLYTAKYGDASLKVAENFTTSFSKNPKSAGDYTMTIEGQEGTDYEGLVYTKDFTIEPKALSNEMIKDATATVKDGEIESIGGVKDGGAALRKGVHFDAKILEANPATDSVNYVVQLTGKGNYTDSVTLIATETAELKFQSVVDHVRFESTEGIYNAKAQETKIVFCDSNDQPVYTDVFEEGTNYYVRYNGSKRGSNVDGVINAESIVDAGEYTATVIGKGKYTGSSITTSNSFVVRPISLTTDNTKVELKQSSFEYSDSLVIRPEIKDVTYTVSDTETRGLAAGTDYVLKNDEYARDIGGHNVTVLGLGNYEGEASAKYNVFASLLNSAKVALDNVIDGEMRAEQTAEWDYVWTHNKAFTYTGNAIKPGFTVKVNDDPVFVGTGDGYMTVSNGVNNTKVSTNGNKAYFILTLPAKYANKKIKVEFEIAAKPLPADALVLEDVEDMPYAYGKEITLENGSDGYYVVDGESILEEDTDYRISYEDNINAGTATITATGMGNYSGTLSKTFTITPINVKNVTVEIRPQKLNTSGTVVTKMDDVVITVKDKNGKTIEPFTEDDFSLENYKNNKAAWLESSDGPQPRVEFVGKRNLTGTKTVYFTIQKESLEGLEWRLDNKPSVKGTLGSPNTTIDLTAVYGYAEDFVPNLGGRTISLYYGNQRFDYYNCTASTGEAGTNTIKISGKKNYDGGEYYFTYEVRKIDISNCEFKQTEEDNNGDGLPEFTLSYNGTVLTKGSDYTEEVNAEKDESGKYPVGESGYSVTFTGLDSYEGTLTKPFHVGKPFDKDHVFITMVGPVGTKRTNSGENRLTYFGNNDPYFILTSNKNAKESKIDGPSYTNGTYDNSKGDYSVTFASNSSDRHDVNSTVTVTFKAQKESNTWYNPEGSDGIKYEYKVWPGAPANVGENYGNLAAGLSIYTNVGTPDSKEPEVFNPDDAGYGEIIFKDFTYKYTTEEIDPDIYIQYDPSKVGKTYLYASEITEAGRPTIGTDKISYSSELIDVKFNNQRFFNATKEKISAKDPDAGRVIKITPASGGWLTSPSFQVYYTFKNAKLSDATIAPEGATYIYSGKDAAVSYNVTIGTTALRSGTDYELEGYYKYPESGVAYEAITAAKANKSLIGEKLSGFGDKVTPKNVGRYVLVIKAVNGSHYEGYNIAEFSIERPNNFSSVTTAAGLSVEYKGAAGTAVPTADMLKDKLTVIGVNGEKLDPSDNDSIDGYEIVSDAEQMNKPRTDAWVWVKGTGNYAGCEEKVFYSIVANISPNESPNFSRTEPYTKLAEFTSASSCLKLTLKNDGDNGLPFIDETTRFDLSKLTLSDGSVTLDRDCLTIDVFGLNGSDNDLKSIGKKRIKVSGATEKPVTGAREYYVEVFADISTADVTLQVDGKDVDPTQIPYTGQSMIVNPVVKFRGKILFENTDYTIDGSKSYEKVGTYTDSMTVKGNHEGDVAGKYYAGTKSITFTIVYDLSKDGVQIKYIKDTTNKLLSEMSFPYTGESIGGKIGQFVKVIVKNGTYKELEPGQNKDYILEFEKDREPGVASATIRPVSTKSMNSQTVYFSIGGNTLDGSNCKIEWRNPGTVNDYVYDGTAKEPDVIVSYRENTEENWTELRKDYDYEVYYSNNINATTDTTTDTSKAVVTVTGINGRFNSSVKKEFGIKPKSLDDVTVEFKDIPFGGKNAGGRLPGKAVITVKDGDKTLKEGTDYTVKYGDGDGEDAATYLKKNPGEPYDITVTGMGNYTGDVVGHPVQLYGNLEGSNIVIASPLTSEYDGEEVALSPVIKNGDWTLVEGTDYTIEIPEKILDAKTYNITITAVSGGDYDNNGAGSSRTFSYTVTPRPINGNIGDSEVTLYDPATGNSATNFKWTGDQIKPWVRVEDKGIPGHYWTNKNGNPEGPMKDFEVTYGDNKTAGSSNGTVTITAKANSNYTGSIKKTFSIGTDIANAMLSYDKTSVEYDGTPKNQNITVSYNGETLTPGTAYESPVKYTWKGGETSTPSAVGEYTPVIKGKPEGGFYGEKQGAPFRIIAQNKTGNIKIKFNGVVGGEVDAADYVCHYNTKKQTPSISVYDTSGGTDVALTENVDYTVSYGNNTNAGSGYVYVALKGNYTGTAQEIFTIQPYDISNATLEFTEGENGIIKNVPEASFPYSPLFKLIGTDDNGEQFVISYADSRQKQDLSIPDSSKVKKPGKGSLAVSGTGNNLYSTTNAYDYEVYGRLSEKNVIVTPPINTGVKKDPEVKVVFAGETLVLDTDYSLRIVPFDQTVSGGGNVIVEGLGYFTGSVYTKYGEASDVSSLTLRGFSQQYIYSGVFAGPQESAIYAVDKDGNTVISADKLECTFTSDKDNAACITANATVTITTKATLEDGTVQDGPKATYKIVPRNINSCDIMRLENDIYTGKALKPPVAVSFRRKEYTFGSTGGIAEEKVLDVITLKEGTDYSLSYKNNVYPGTADITVTGKGNYTGTRLFHFVINVISMGSVNAKRTSDGIVVSWGARPYVAGYRVLYDTEKLTAVSTTGTTVTLKDALPTRVGVQPYILGSGKTPIYGAAKYIDVS